MKTLLDDAKSLPRVGNAAFEGDGRNVAPALGILAGEGSHMDVRSPEEGYPVRRAQAEGFAREKEPGTYYGLPAIKEPVWKWYIPAYFYMGGLAGASAWIGACAQFSPRTRRMVTRTRVIAAGAIAASAALLIADLGRPSRFHHMLRVFRPTSPMSMGTWLLSAAGGSSAAALGLGLRPGTRRLADGAGVAAGVLGLPLSGYTAVLIAHSVVPVWSHTGRSLPILFVTSAFTSAASALELLPSSRTERRVVRGLAIASKTAELVADYLVAADAKRVARVALPLEGGASGALFRASRWVTAASLLLSLGSRRASGFSRAAGLLGTLGSLATRFAIAHAGIASARDPRATFEPQRASASGSLSRSVNLAPAPGGESTDKSPPCATAMRLER